MINWDLFEHRSYGDLLKEDVNRAIQKWKRGSSP